MDTVAIWLFIVAMLLNTGGIIFVAWGGARLIGQLNKRVNDLAIELSNAEMQLVAGGPHREQEKQREAKKNA